MDNEWCFFAIPGDFFIVLWCCDEKFTTRGEHGEIQVVLAWFLEGKSRIFGVRPVLKHGLLSAGSPAFPEVWPSQFRLSGLLFLSRQVESRPVVRGAQAPAEVDLPAPSYCGEREGHWTGEKP